VHNVWCCVASSCPRPAKGPSLPPHRSLGESGAKSRMLVSIKSAEREVMLCVASLRPHKEIRVSKRMIECSVALWVCVVGRLLGELGAQERKKGGRGRGKRHRSAISNLNCSTARGWLSCCRTTCICAVQGSGARSQPN
jgi:hypothetical protein